MGRQFVSGKEAALLAAEGKPFRQTENGVILFPYREADAEHTEEPGQRLTKLRICFRPRRRRPTG